MKRAILPVALGIKRREEKKKKNEQKREKKNKIKKKKTSVNLTKTGQYGQARTVPRRTFYLLFHHQCWFPDHEVLVGTTAEMYRATGRLLLRFFNFQSNVCTGRSDTLSSTVPAESPEQTLDPTNTAVNGRYWQWHIISIAYLHTPQTRRPLESCLMGLIIMPSRSCE